MSRLSSITKILRDGVTGVFSCPSRRLFAEGHARSRWIRLIRSRLLDQRQRQNKCRPGAPAAAGGADGTAHLVHRDGGRMQAEAVPVLLRRKAETKDVFEVFIPDAVARV